MGYDVTIAELLRDRIIRFDPAKSEKLKADRGISLERISSRIKKGEIFSIERNPSTKYAHQYLCEVDIEGYIYVVPIVVKADEVFIKTAYPSRKATKKYRKRSIV